MASPRPTENDMQDPRTLGAMVMNLQSAPGTRRTSRSLSGIPQQQVTAPDISEILQGTRAVRKPSDTLLLVNKGLSGNLERAYNQGFGGISTFSTAPRNALLDTGVASPYATATTGVAGDGFSGAMGQLTGEQVAQVAYQVGFRDEDLQIMVAVAKGESMWDSSAVGDVTLQDSTWGPSIGLWQIRSMKAELGTGSARDATKLEDPVYNGQSAWSISEQGTKFSPWSIYNRGTYRQYMTLAQQVIANAQSQGLLGKPFVNTGGVGGLSSSNAGNTIDELKFAGQILANHPNNWLARNDGFRNTLLSGASSTRVTLFNSGGRAFLFPSLLNYLYLLFQGGFILDGYLGSIGFKYISGTSKISNHSYGGAIDIGKIGIASEGRTYSLSGSDARRPGDKLFNYLSTLPKTAWADEHGCDWAANYGSSGFRTYFDDNHIHLGFDETRPGTLMTALKPRTSGGGGAPPARAI